MKLDSSTDAIFLKFLFLDLCVCLIASSTAWGQNLVPNPSFENHKAIHCGFISVLPRTVADSITLRPDNISNYVNDWYTPTSGSTDYWYFTDSTQRFNQALDCYAGASLENKKPTKARTGNGYIGLYVSSKGLKDNYREYAQVKLTKPLKANVVYHVSFIAQLSSGSLNCTNRLGVLLSNLPITRPQQVAQTIYGEPLLYTPQLSGSDLLCQPRQWLEVSRCFQAVGGEEYLTIGNFFDDASTPLQPTATTNGQFTSYYLVDDVLVEEVGGSDYLPAAHFLGPDTTLCPRQSFQVTIPFTGGSVYWPGGDTSRTMNADQAGIYIAQISVGKCSVSDTLQVRVVPTLTLPADTILCRGEAINLTVTDGVGQIRWEDNSTERIRLVNQAGTYWLTTQSQQCSQSDTIHVDVIDCPGIVPNVITPNKDGKNDTFFIANIELTPWALTIYNRWGSMVYHTDYYHNEWEALGDPVGVYYYLLREQRTAKLVKGWVAVVR